MMVNEVRSKWKKRLLRIADIFGVINGIVVKIEGSKFGTISLFKGCLFNSQ
jgi:hypothetical protein